MDTNHKELFFQPGVSALSINEYMRSPRKFWRTSSYNPNRVKAPATDAMIFGRLIHCMILTPEQYDKEFVIKPEKEGLKNCLDTVDDLKKFIAEKGGTFKTSFKKADLIAVARSLDSNIQIFDLVLEHFYATVGKRQVVSKADYDKAKAMQDAMFANGDVMKLLGNGCSEEPITWQREENGLLCKIKLDYNRAGLILDYKTTEDSTDDAFSKSIGNYGYHRQMAWGMEGIEAVNKERPRGAVVIAQEKSNPEDIEIYALTAKDLELGAKECDFAYNGIKRRLQSQDWAIKKGIRSISLPGWYYKRSEDRMALEEI